MRRNHRSACRNRWSASSEYAPAGGQRAHGPGGGGVADQVGGPPEGGGGAGHHRAAGQGVLLEVHRAVPGVARRLLSAQRAAVRLARRLPGRLGDGRRRRGRGPGVEDHLRRAVGEAAPLGRAAETDRAGRGGTRSRGVGDHDERRRSDQHRGHRARRGVARLQRGRGAVVEQRIEELGQLSAGRTAVDDLGGNALPSSLAALAYQLLHILRANCLGRRWRVVQPRGIRLRLLRAPARITSHARRP